MRDARQAVRIRLRRDVRPGHVLALIPVLAGAFLFNLGQGVLRPTMPLYLSRIFSASYQMVTLIPVVFGVGKWVASLPTGYLIAHLGGRPLMAAGLLLIAFSDVGSVTTDAYGVFLGWRALGGAGWAAFSTVATTVMVDQAAANRRGRAVSLLLMSETLGLLVGSAAGGWLYQSVGLVSPFVFEAACMLIGLIVISRLQIPARASETDPVTKRLNARLLIVVLRTPGVLLMSLTNAALIAIQTGVLVFLFPLYLTERGGLTPKMVGLFVSLSVVGRLIGLWFAGVASDRWGRLRILVPGLLVYAALLASLPLLTNAMALALWSMASGIAIGGVAGLPTSLIGDRVDSELRGVAIGWLRTATDTGHILGALVMGALADATHLAAPFLLAATLLLTIAWRSHRQATALVVE